MYEVCSIRQVTIGLGFANPIVHSLPDHCQVNYGDVNVGIHTNLLVHKYNMLIFSKVVLKPIFKSVFKILFYFVFSEYI